MNTKRIALFTTLAAAGILSAWALMARDSAKPAPALASAPALLRAEGRMAAYPGADVVVGTDVGGTLERVLVQEGDAVKAGQVLAYLDARQQQAALREARSRVSELEADLRFLDREAQRNAALQAGGILSRQALEQVQNQLALAQARREAAAATAERLAVTVEKLAITAPRGGIVLTRWVHPGETVSAGARLVQIADPGQLRVEAEIDEYDLSRVRLGSAVTIRAEGYDGSWKGSVEEIPEQVVGRRLKPQDPARPSDTRILMVKVKLLEPCPLKLGQRVELELGQR